MKETIYIQGKKRKGKLIKIKILTREKFGKKTHAYVKEETIDNFLYIHACVRI